MVVLFCFIIDHYRKLREFFVISLNNLSQVFASRLFLIQSSHAGFTLTEDSGNRLNVFHYKCDFSYFQRRISINKSRCHYRLLKYILKILTIYRNNFPKRYYTPDTIFINCLHIFSARISLQKILHQATRILKQFPMIRLALLSQY